MAKQSASEKLQQSANQNAKIKNPKPTNGEDTGGDTGYIMGNHTQQTDKEWIGNKG